MPRDEQRNAEPASPPTAASLLKPTALQWWMVAVVAALTVLSFIDRNALSILIDQIKKDFGANDTHAGLLLGASFAILYGLAGLPAGYLIDRFSRRLVIFTGVVFWSLMTALSGLATGFGLLFIGRMGVGLGEAVLHPAAVSLIRNVFPLKYRPRALGILTAASSAGGGIALFTVGGLVNAVPDNGVTAPFGHFEVWQIVLIIIGLIGLPLACLAYTFPEPKRPPVEAADQRPSVAFFFQWIHEKRAFYGPMFLAQALTGIGSHGFAAWMPAAIARKWHIAPGTVGLTYGPIQIAAALCGLLIGTNVLVYLLKRASSQVTLTVGAIAIAITAGACMLAPLMPTLPLTWAMVALHWLSVPTCGVCAVTAITAATPNPTLGKVTATSNLCLSLTGYGVGPSLVAAVSTAFVGPTAIGSGLSIVAGVALVLSAIFYYVAGRNLVSVEKVAEGQR